MKVNGLLILALSLSSVVCAIPMERAKQTALSRATFQLNCPSEQLHIKVIEADSVGAVSIVEFGIKGCGRRAIYRIICGSGRCQMDSKQPTVIYDSSSPTP